MLQTIERLRIRRAVLLMLAATALLAVAGCSSDEEPEPNALTISGTEFSFDTAEGVLTPGTNEITFRNDGAEVHHVQLVQLLDGKTLDDVGPALEASETEGFPGWMRFASGVGQMAPGGSGTIVTNVEAGNYALLCFVPDSDGVPHFARGMIGALSTEGDASEAELPAASVSLTAIDYQIEGPAAIEAGEDVVIELTNDGTEIHEANLVQLAPGATVEDFLAGLAPNSTEPPPGTPIGGIQAVMPGKSERLTVDLAAGNYVLICYIPNAEGTPHFVLGMASGLEVTD